MTEDRHIDDAGFTAEGAGFRQVGTIEGCSVPFKSPTGGQLESAAMVLPRAGECGEHADSTRGCAAIVAALHTVVEADDGGGGGCVIVGEALDVGDRDAGQR